MDGNIRDTAPIITVPREQDRSRWNALSKELAPLRQQANARKEAARSDFECWLTEARPEQVTARIPSAGLRLHASLSEGDGKTVHLTVDAAARAVTLESGIAWDTGHIAAKAFKSQAGGTIEVADAGEPVHQFRLDV